ncbi:hypothetical protein LTR78_007561 [Recurvomyces mirabilis]|uniref:Uncharacterized protein n=1 Tax=Recurvomyces mirabilis TaxID=574656 RepID=A0AAE0WG24_9PEZI|nr:hypothetical protein LTR78_007561 [Recurvomyces mirabilis]KAK5159927.1 hypothetical protein LTS14_002033 [Recurvomyces mirabilis]
MKCDEVKPLCGPCSKGDRECIYGLATNEEDEPQTSHSVSSQASVYVSAPQHNTPQQHRTSFSSNPDSRALPQRQWPTTPVTEEPVVGASPQSNFSTSTGYGTEVAPLRWFGLLAGDAQNGDLNLPALDSLSDVQRYLSRHETGPPAPSISSPRTPLGFSADSLQNPSRMLQISALSPAPPNGGPVIDERQYWQAAEPIQLKDHEHDMYQRFVLVLSLWIDMFDPLKHFSALVPRLAIRNEGLMKAILALGSRHLSIKPVHSGEAVVDRTAAVQYYYETLQYLQNAMRFTSYKNSPELLATVLTVSLYEMIDGAGKGWERHLKGVFWIQRSRDINGESGGLEQAIWWAWLRQDFWAAFRERRRCFSFYKPTKPYHVMDVWDMASREVYILAQCVNYSSDEEKQNGERDLGGRIMRANTLLNMLDEWRNNISIHFQQLPLPDSADRAFRPIWIHPPALGTSLQMYSMARILLLIHQPAAGGYLEYLGRDKIITECIDMIGGIALKACDDASRLMSTQCLYAAGLYCTDSAKRQCIAELISEFSVTTGWPTNTDLAEELRVEWSKQKPG